jgi:plastocyanin
VRRRIALAAALVVVAALTPAGTAAADVTVLAVDGTAENEFKNTWSPMEVTIKAGEAVTWTFPDSDGFHNVASDSPNWTLDNPISARHPPVTHSFPDSGTYRFVCDAHASTMWGNVYVTDASGAPPPPPPPPPLSEQPFPNDQQPPPTLEVGDEKRPRLSRVRVTAVRDGARVRFRLSERARVSVRFKLAGLTVKTARRTFRAGARSLTVRDRRLRGSYRVEVFARDAADNRSRTVRHQVSIR